MRQLQNVLRNAVILNTGRLITQAMLPELILHQALRGAAAAMEGTAPLIEPLAVVEKRMILAALLEVNSSTIHCKLNAWKSEE